MENKRGDIMSKKEKDIITDLFTSIEGNLALINNEEDEIIDLKSKKLLKKIKGSGRKANNRAKSEPIRDTEQLAQMRRYFYDKYLKTDNINMKHKHLRNHTIFIVGLNTALRMSDILKLTWRDLLGKEEIFIREQKTGKLNDIPMNEEIKKVIQEYQEFYEKNNIKYTIDESVFLGKKYTNILSRDDPDIIRAEKTYTKVLKEAAKKIGIKDNIGTHSMRKTYCYWFLINNKNDPYAASRLQKDLNHSDLKITLGYAGFSKEQRQKDKEDMDKFYQSVDKGEVKIYDDKITVSKGQVEELIQYAYTLGKENSNVNLDTDLDNLDTIKSLLEENILT